MSKSRTCQYCAYYDTGEIDLKVHWMHCTKGYRLISDEQYIREYHPFNDPDEEIIRITWDSWTDLVGTGPAMLERFDCRDWKKRNRSFTLENIKMFNRGKNDADTAL